MSASGPLDRGGTTAYEEELIRKHKLRIAAAMPSAVATFSVPTTTLLKAGQFQKQEILRRKKVAAAKAQLPALQVPPSILANVGYGPLQEVRTTGYAIQQAGAVLQAQAAAQAAQAAQRAGVAPVVTTQFSAADQALIAQAAKGQITQLASTPAAQQAQNLAMAQAATKGAISTTPPSATGLERYPGQFAAEKQTPTATKAVYNVATMGGLTPSAPKPVPIKGPGGTIV